EFRRNEDFSFITLLENQGWLNFYTFHEPHYPLLIQIFYSNIISDDNDFSFRSYVKGLEFNIDVELISLLTGCPNEGVCDFEEFDRREAISTIFEENYHEEDVLTANLFNLQNHLLHWTINHIIHPRSGSLNLFNDLHLFFLSHILRGVQVNLPLFILKSM